MAAELTVRSDAVISCSCVLLLAIGCGEAAPPSFTTDHLTVFPSDSDLVCRGTLDNLEAQVVRAAGILRLETPRTLHVDLGASAVETYCGDDVGGQALLSVLVLQGLLPEGGPVHQRDRGCGERRAASLSAGSAILS